MSNIRVSSRQFKFIYYFLQLTWGIIQNILGFFVYLFVRISDPKCLHCRFFCSFACKWKLRSSMSLGMFLFIGEDNYRVLVHEYGHSIQSMILGPFYLPLIGIPSLIWAQTPRYKRKRRKGIYRYSSFYPERWANYLGRKYTTLDSITY